MIGVPHARKRNFDLTWLPHYPTLVFLLDEFKIHCFACKRFSDLPFESVQSTPTSLFQEKRVCDHLFLFVLDALYLQIADVYFLGISQVRKTRNIKYIIPTTPQTAAFGRSVSIPGRPHIAPRSTVDWANRSWIEPTSARDRF